ncbi:MAG: hypothetical protein KGH61_05135 [Candidatus Micrarchaeota archaeon]|nr:hypothetical protein [Candidatus Micrarchaeota archaeon]MDE1848299.1 hypothetical protein [Candidatus Micrarchaeota archaeon]MDE1864752.1 hypothetical protein [Candidatus Micrarchaeota archaeon]
MAFVSKSREKDSAGENFTRIGVVSGRFQPYHNRHQELLIEAMSKTDRLMVLASDLPTFKHFPIKILNSSANLFSFEERRQMITNGLIDAGARAGSFDVRPFTEYVRHISKRRRDQEIIYCVAGKGSVSRIISRMLASFCNNVERLDVKITKDPSATQIRKLIMEEKHWEHLVPRSTAEVVMRVQELQKRH